MGKISTVVEVMPRITARTGQLFSIPVRLVNCYGILEASFLLRFHAGLSVKKIEPGKGLHRDMFEKVTLPNDGEGCAYIHFLDAVPLRVNQQPLCVLRVSAAEPLSSDVEVELISVNGGAAEGLARNGRVYVA